ncbi:TAP-like protein-domain-containing protein [Corynascus novoguineensis]|uniref:TAP-like protein-domain-containing protein n=1 Tax=Corynascus novoguineensis TaxID=1126955 RepID=A0AAN7CU14_9PEZI|nr:TAP-like protein-domain-containing protein [Corynascus novoguineensis]
MALARYFTRLALATSALAIPLHTRDNNGPSGGIRWGSCDFESAGTGPIECGTLAVPLDYTDAASTEKLTLSLIRSPAQTNGTVSKKSILFNFGGPGYEAIHSLNSAADLLHGGVGETLTFSCFETATDRQLANYKYPLLDVDAHESALAETFANMQVLTNVCHERYKNSTNPEFLGTAFVARDLISVVDALGEDGLLRYWGFSYGSLLGATVAAMFPSRMDRVVLDGVVNANNYYHRFGIDVDQLLSADAAFRAILAQCIEAGPARCALASLDNASTVADLEATLWRAVDRYRKGPVAAGTVDVVDTHLFRELLFITIKYPTNVAVAAQHIRNLVAGTNLTEAASYYRALSEGIAMPDDSLYGISCSDKFPRTDSLAGILPDVERMLETSELFGSQIGSIAAVCPSWPWAAKERYDGGFAPGSIKTKTPILLFGNTYDPVTPLPSARNMSAAFEGSVVVEQHGFGHATISQASACTAQVLRAYFVNGTLPAEGTVCDVDSTLF